MTDHTPTKSASTSRREALKALTRLIDNIPTDVLDAVVADLPPPRRRLTPEQARKRYGDLVGDRSAVRAARQVEEEDLARRGHRLATALLLDCLRVQSVGSGEAHLDAQVMVGTLVDEYGLRDLRRPPRSPVTPEERMRRRWEGLRPRLAPVVLQRDGAICRSCGGTSNLTIDHRLPIARGGTNELDNLQVLCKSCNNRKRTRTDAELEAAR